MIGPRLPSGSRPARIRSTIWRRNSGEYVGRDFGISCTSGENLRVSTKTDQSHIETAKHNGLNPEAYLAYAIDQLAHGHLASSLAELLPWNCKDAVKARAT